MSQTSDGTPVYQNKSSLSRRDFDDAQHALILEHYRSPRNNRSLSNPDIQSTEVNHFCGDETTIQVRVDKGVLEEVGIRAIGCSICQASLSMLSEAVHHLTLAEAELLSRTFQKMMLGENLDTEETILLGDLNSLAVIRKHPIRVKCALLAWIALDVGLRDYQPNS